MTKRIGDSDRSGHRRRAESKPKSKPVFRSKPMERSKSHDNPKSENARTDPHSDRGDRAQLAIRRDREHLNRDPGETRSDPVGSRGIVSQQADTARDMTGRGDSDNTPRFRTIADRENDGSPANDLPPDEAVTPKKDLYSAGTVVEPAPDLEGEEPSEVEGPRRTYQVEGREVTRTQRADGSVVTSYEDENGNPYTETTNSNGTSNVRIGGEAAPGEDLNSRTIEYDAEGKIVSEQIHRQSFHEDGGQERERIQNVDYGPDGKPVETFERENTYDDSGNELSTNLREVSIHPDGTQDVFERIKNEDGSGVIGSHQVGPRGNWITDDRFRIDRGGVDQADFTRKLNQLAASGDSEQLENILQFVGKEDLARVSLEAAQGDPEALREFIGAGSAAADISPDVARRLAEALHDGVATDRYSLRDTARDDARITEDTVALTGALGEQISDGGSSNLGVTFLDQLNDSRARVIDGTNSEEPGSDDVDLETLSTRLDIVASGLTDGFQSQFRQFDEATNAADEQSGRLAQLTESYGPFMTAEERSAATAEFLRNHESEYEAADAASGKLVTNLDGLNRLEAILGDATEQTSGIPGLNSSSETARELINQTPDAVVRASETKSGSRELANALAREGVNEGSTFLPGLNEMSLDSNKRERLDSAIENVGISAAAEATTIGDSERRDQLLDGIGVTSENFSPEAIATLKTFADGTGDIEIARNSPDFDARIGRAASILGVANLVAKGVDIGSADAEALIGLGADSVGVGTDVFKTGLEGAFGANAVKTAGRVASGVGLVLGVVDTLQALGEGDNSTAALSALSTVGGALVASNTVPIVGHALVAVALVGAVGLAQYRKAEASNYFEGDDGDHPGAADARRFIGHALEDSKLSESAKSAIINTLKDSDDDGTLPGERIRDVARAAGLPPNYLFNRIAELGPEDAGTVINAVHSIGGSNTGLLREIGAEDIYRDVTNADLKQYIEQKFGIT